MHFQPDFVPSLAKSQPLSVLHTTFPSLFLDINLPVSHAHTHLMCFPPCSPEPHAGFKIAFNMFDADGNQMVDKREFMVVSR